MAHPVNDQVLIFTPVVSVQYWWSDALTSYLNPFGKWKAYHLPIVPREDGSEAAIRILNKREWFDTAWIVVSYVVSFGILPLLALIVAVTFRCKHKFYWVLPIEEQGLQPWQQERAQVLEAQRLLRLREVQQEFERADLEMEAAELSQIKAAQLETIARLRERRAARMLA